MVAPLAEGEATIVGFADNLTSVALPNHPKDVEIYTMETLSVLKSQAASGDEKWEVVLIFERRKENTVKVIVNGDTVVLFSLSNTWRR